MISALRSSVPVIAAMLFAGSTSAADIASVRPIGFSADGAVFVSAYRRGHLCRRQDDGTGGGRAEKTTR